MYDEQREERRLEREARETCLGTLGNREGANVAKVQVSWMYERNEWHAGYYLVHATGDEPECQGEDGTIYAVFEELTHEAMQRRQERQGFYDYEITDVSAA